ncbi:hypothetical protein HY500_03140 [Candidatus Woesearchaeota archaeon]|nr:hypothetical protein [Candidatus Woesearchaeota archaeon]
MQKRNLVIFSLIVISVLFIAGCQQTVGKRASSTVNEVSYTYKIGSDSLNVKAFIGNPYAHEDQPGECRATTGEYIKIGQDIRLEEYGDTCYKVIGCIAVEVSGRLDNQRVIPRGSSRAFNGPIISGGSNGVLLMAYDQPGFCNVNTPSFHTANMNPIFVNGYIYTGF